MRHWMFCAASAASLWISPANAAEPWVGRWAANPANCTGFGGNTAQTSALVVTDTSLNWYSGYCRIGKMYKLGQAAYIQARCTGEGPSEVPVTLDPRGDRMRVTWNRGKTEDVQRCK